MGAKNFLLISKKKYSVAYLKEILNIEENNIKFIDNAIDAEKFIGNFIENNYLVAVDISDNSLHDLAHCYYLQVKYNVPFIFLIPINRNPNKIDSKIFEIEDSMMILLSKNIIFDKNGGRIINRGKVHNLTMTELKLMDYLWKFRNQVIKVKSIINNVWGYDSYTTSSSVYVYIRRLREKIEENPDSPKLLVTCRGHGYILKTKSDGGS